MPFATIAALAAASLACARMRPAPGAAEETPPVLQLPRDARPIRCALELTVDPSKEGFTGTAEIEIALDRPRRVVWLHGLDLHVASASVEPAGAAPVSARWTQVNGEGLARLDLPREVGPGRATLRFAWSAAWGPLVGLYVSRAGGAGYAATQFEPIEARRAFPGFDEPSFKAPFDVSLVVPEANVAISNGPEVSSAPAGRGLKRVRFSTTRPLPTYLLFLGVGPFDVVTPPPLPPNEVRRTPLRVRGLAHRGAGAELGYALAAGGEELVLLERYFGIPFPYSKLDHLAIPDFAWGGMENAGAIAYAERALLFAEGRSSEDQRQLVAAVVAHEMAHQWFGDLVTLGWWTDTWLNESFATWMADRIVREWRPEWRVGLPWLEATEGAMQADSLRSARAVRQPLVRLSDIDIQFDPRITYQKGAAVLASFERFAGPAAFRAGIHRYLEQHADGVGSTPDLLAALSRAAGRDLAKPFATFIDQPGVPLVQARAVCDPERGARVELVQSRSLPRGSEASAEGLWGVPVCVRFAVGPLQGERCTLIEARTGTIALPEGCPGWLLPNAGAAGYYRWALAPADLSKLRASGLARLDPLERVSVVNNLVTAQRAGALGYADAAAALLELARDRDAEVAAATLAPLLHARRDLVGGAARSSFDALARRLFRPALDRLGWARRPGEAPPDTRARGRLVQFLALEVRDPDARREASRLGAAYVGLADGRFHPEAVDPDVAPAALSAAVADGGAPVFEALLERLRTLDDGRLRRRIGTALAHTEDPALLSRAARLWRDDRVRPGDRGSLVESLGNRPASRAALLAAVEEDPNGFVESLPSGHRAFALTVFEGFCDPRDAKRVRASLGRSVKRFPEIREALEQAIERIRLCATERDADGAAASRFFEEASLHSDEWTRPGSNR